MKLDEEIGEKRVTIASHVMFFCVWGTGMINTCIHPRTSVLWCLVITIVQDP